MAKKLYGSGKKRPGGGGTVGKSARGAKRQHQSVHNTARRSMKGGRKGNW